MKYLIAVSIVAVLISGCAKRVGVVKQAEPLEGDEVIVWQRPDVLPCWVDSPRCYDKKLDGHLYFAGIGKPDEYEDGAVSTAIDAAGLQIAQYLSKSVDWRKHFSESLLNANGYTSVRSYAEKVAGAQFARTIFKGQYLVTRATQRVKRKDYGANILHFKVFALVEFPNTAVAGALAATKDELRSELTRERDEIKRELLKGNLSAIDALEKEYSTR